MNAADRRLAGETTAATLVVFVLVALISAATDEPSSTSATRAARLLAFAPLACAAAVAWSLFRRDARGETAALAALGQGRSRGAAGAHAAGWAIGALCSLGLLVPWVDTASLFPIVQADSQWTVAGSALLEPASGVRVDRDLGLMLVRRVREAPAGSAASQAGAALFVAPLAAVAPPWASGSLGVAARVATLVASAALAVVLLHVVAAGQANVLWLTAAALPLAAGAAFGHKGPR